MATFTVTTTAEQDALLEEVVRLQNRDGLASTPASLVQAWALHPLNARLEEARKRDERRNALVALAASGDPEIKAKVGELMALVDRATKAGKGK